MKTVPVQLDLPVTVMKEGDDFIAHSPALDLSSVGETADVAQKNLEEAAQLFFEEIISQGTFEEVLLELGWTKGNKEFLPPVLVSQNIKQFSVQGPADIYA